MDNPQNFLPHVSIAHGDKLCDRFEDASVIRTIARHHIYRHFTPTIGKTPQSRKEPSKEPNNDLR